MEPQQTARAGAAARRPVIGAEWVDSEGWAMLPSLVQVTGEAVAAAGIRWITVQHGSRPFPL